MSARMLQRALRNNQGQASPGEIVSPHGDTSDSDRDEGREPVSNPFDLLRLQEEDESEDEDVERGSHQQSASGSASTRTLATASFGPNKSKRKKSKGRKKGKKDSTFDDKLMVSGDVEPVDKLLERLAVGSGEGSSSISCGSCSSNGKSYREDIGQASSVLGVDLKHLRAEDELRRIFGSKVINSVERRGEGVRSMRRQGPGGRRNGRGMPLRKSSLVVPMEHWARWDGGITMECVRVEGHIKHFRYQYSVSYEEVQKRFESCVASHDPNNLLMLLHSHPYHADTLLALSEVYKQMGQHQQSANLLDQCLYALECAWHPWFNPSLGFCRLEFSWDKNKALFLALFRHMQHLGRRGCHRTALEVCKFLLSLDPSDPLGALFCIDYFSLRAQQYEWLEHFVDEYESDKSIQLLPNFSFSVAVARFYGEDQQHDKSKSTNNDIKRKEGCMGSKASSANLLQQALMLHPSALTKIIAKASIKEDQSWAKIISHSHFSQAQAGGPTLEHLIDIYVERNYLIWRSPDLQGWLKEAAAAVTQIAEKSLHSASGAEMANWECVRNEVFPSDENEYNHLHVSEFSDSTSTLPPEDMPQLGLHPFGGLIGEDMLREVDLPYDEDQLLEADFPGRNALLLFLQSLVPRMDYGDDAYEDDTPALLDDDSNGND
ncbi:unnamed protein product [Calypogeia fissa]